jgi:hypothetical protein
MSLKLPPLAMAKREIERIDQLVLEVGVVPIVFNKITAIKEKIKIRDL